MANKDSRYNVKLTLGYEIVNVNGEPFTSVGPLEVKYSSMDYLQICNLQSLMVGIGKTFTDFGQQSAAAMGLTTDTPTPKKL
jgi:hypothetical protein